MGRLIDADTLLKKFDDTGIHITFDLPVEEILGEGVDIDDFSMLVQDTIQAYKKMVIETIKEQPTAYNVEAVVAELEKRANDNDRAADRLCGIESKKKIASWRARAQAFRDSAEIVRGKE